MSMSMNDIVADFCEHTSCHSLNRVGDRQRKLWVRIIWFTIFVVGVSVLSSQLVQLVIRYRRHDVIVDTVLEFRELSLPAITICNMNMMPKSKMNKIQNTFLEAFITLFEKLYTENVTNALQSNFCSSTPERFQRFCEEAVNVSFSKAELGNRVGTDFKPTLMWQNTIEVSLPVIISKAEKSQLDQLASEAGKMLLECSLENHDCTDFAVGFYNSQYGMCVTVTPPEDYQVQAGGPLEGITMLLDVNSEEYLPLIDSVGVKIFVHHPNKSYDMESSGIYASVGSRTAVALKLTNTTKLGTPYGHCFDQRHLDEIAEKHLFYFSGDYSVSGCMKTCLQKRIIRLCGCMLLGYGLPPVMPEGVKYCWQTSLACALEAQRHAAFHKENNLIKCGCFPPCNNMQFITSISSVPWPALHSPYSVYCPVPNRNCSQNPINYYRENILKLHVFYDTLNYNQFIERPDYSLVDLFTDFGGNLGLFLGASVCTCCEGLSLVVSMILFVCGSKKKNFEKKTEPAERIPLNLKNYEKEIKMDDGLS